MSFLTPLYILGALAVVGPILAHLIRRTTRGEVPFSSLMFLSPSPPRLTRKSRLDRWFLLLLRATALILLALAFARPFLRQADDLGFAAQESSRVAILIDTSASMRRGDLWTKAKAAANAAIDACGPGDQLAVFAFDSTSRMILGFEESASLDPSRRSALAASLVDRLAPGWGSSHLGRALIDSAGAIEDVGEGTRKAPKLRRKIVLIGDLQQGSRLDELGDFEWPRDVELDLKTVTVRSANAGLQWAAGPAEGETPAPGAADGLRVRVSNDAGSSKESFQLAWSDDTTPPTPVYVPPGESRVVRVPRPAGARTLRLRGDAEDFDNAVHLAVEARESATVLYLGTDGVDDPNGLGYYLARVFEDTPQRTIKVERRSSMDPLTLSPGASVPLIVLAGETSAANAATLRRHAEAGGTVLAVVTSAGRASSLAALVNTSAFDVGESPGRGDAMLSDIAFDHPLFAPFAAPQFNDFTRVRFWQYRRIPPAALGDARILARFEKGEPAVIEKVQGRGRVVILASGWGPADSQLARSSKFPPLMAALLDTPGRSADLPAARVVGSKVPLPEGATSIRKPDGSTIKLASGASMFDGASEPGVYLVQTARGPREFAVNLDPSESRTSPLEPETLERLGCRLASSEAKVEAGREATRQLQIQELEGRQKLWRPLILAAIAILIVETWLAGRLVRTQPNRVEGDAP